jgi:hypothetical protein
MSELLLSAVDRLFSGVSFGNEKQIRHKIYLKKNENDWLADRINEWTHSWMDGQKNWLVNDLRMTTPNEIIN